MLNVDWTFNNSNIRIFRYRTLKCPFKNISNNWIFRYDEMSCLRRNFLLESGQIRLDRNRTLPAGNFRMSTVHHWLELLLMLLVLFVMFVMLLTLFTSPVWAFQFLLILSRFCYWYCLCCWCLYCCCW